MVRKDFTPSEAVAIRRAIGPTISAAAKQRQIRRSAICSAESAEQTENQPKSHSATESRAQVAAYTGISHTTLWEAEEVVKAAEVNPERFGPQIEAVLQ